MKTIKSTTRLTQKFTFIFLLMMLIGRSLAAQSPITLSGTVADKDTGEPIPFVHIALMDSSAENLLTGTVSDIDGIFTLTHSFSGNAVLRFSSIGYETEYKPVHAANEEIDFGEISLAFASLSHEAITVVGEVTARTAAGRTSYYLNDTMEKSAASGMDVLKMIPGIQVDFMQNVSLEGSRQIIIFVDGKERDRSFIHQLQPSQISRVDIINSPSAGYDANITGAINIVLHEKTERHFNGHLLVEAPSTTSEMYLFPAYSLNYGTGKLNFYTSYNGEFSYFDVQEFSQRTFSDNTWTSIQNVHQQYWSHKFHYGVDYRLNHRNELSFYGWYNQFSQENSGDARFTRTGNFNDNWNAVKEDEDRNRSAFYSFYYRLIPGNKTGHELSFDAAYHTLNAENKVTYLNRDSEFFQENRMQPSQQALRLRMDYTLPLSGNFRINSGLQTRMQTIRDEGPADFRYSDDTAAAYGAIQFNSSQVDLQVGMRVENFSFGMKGDDINNLTSLFPSASVSYRFPESAHNLRLSYRRSADYPHLYQLNPYLSADDPFSSRTGNPELKPSFRQDVNLEYSLLFGSSFISATLFFTQINDAIQRFSAIDSNGHLETNFFNLGRVRQKGIQLAGALQFSDRTGLQPYLRLYEINTLPVDFARNQNLADKRAMAYEAGFSAFADLGSGVTANLVMQHAGQVQEIQRSAYSGTLYFVSVEKTFSRGLKAGIVSGLPLSKEFVYDGHKINSPDFNYRSEGSILMSAVPFWFRLNYQFSRGSAHHRIMHDDGIAPRVPRKGF